MRLLWIALLALSPIPPASAGAPSAHESAALHQARLATIDSPLSAGPALLKDAAAQEALRSSQPQLFALLMEKAYSLADWGEVLSIYREAPSLRMALLARQDDPTARDAATFLAVVDASPRGATLRPEAEAAVMEWKRLPAELRVLLKRRGAEAAWPTLPIANRFKVLRAAVEERGGELMTAPLGSREFLAQLEKATILAEPYLTGEEVAQAQHQYDQAAKLAAGFERAHALGGVTKELERISAAASLDDASLALAKFFEARGHGDEATSQREEVEAPLSDAEAARLAVLLKRDLLAELVTVPSGRAVLAELAGAPWQVEITPREGNFDAIFVPARTALLFSMSTLAQDARKLGFELREALTDKSKRADLARWLSALAAHELTHYHQALGEGKFDHYSHDYEVEAYGVQRVFDMQKRRSDPAYVDAHRRADDSAFEHSVRSLHNERAIRLSLAASYSEVPSASLVGARLLRSAIKQDAAQRKLVERELLRRANIPEALHGKGQPGTWAATTTTHLEAELVSMGRNAEAALDQFQRQAARTTAAIGRIFAELKQLSSESGA